MPGAPTIETQGQRAAYNAKSDSIVMPAADRFVSAEEYYSCLFHELTHSTGHQKRLNRAGVGSHSFGSPEYAREELTAEMGAAMLCGVCGIDPATIENSAAYVQGWLKRLRADDRLVIKAASQAQKAADYILDTQHEYAEQEQATEPAMAA